MQSVHRTGLNDGIEYRNIPDFPGYRVGTNGAVWSCRYRNGLAPDRWHRLRENKDRDGYQIVVLHRNRQAFRRNVARLVLMAFVGPCPPGMESCHEDGNPGNNALSNLRWDTHANNRADMERHGTSPRGERVGNSKLVALQVQYIRCLAALGMTYAVIARHIGVSKPLIGRIVRRECWAHLAEIPGSQDRRIPRESLVHFITEHGLALPAELTAEEERS